MTRRASNMRSAIPRGVRHAGSSASGATRGWFRLRGRGSAGPLGESIELERAVQGDRDGDAGAGGHVARELLPLEDGVALAAYHVDALPLHDLGDVLAGRNRLGTILLDDLQGEEAALERLVDARIGGRREGLRVLLRRGERELHPVVHDVVGVQVLVRGGRELRPLGAEQRDVLRGGLPRLVLPVPGVVRLGDRLGQLHVQQVERDVAVALLRHREELGSEGARLAAGELGLRVEEPGAREAHGHLALDSRCLREIGGGGGGGAGDQARRRGETGDHRGGASHRWPLLLSADHIARSGRPREGRPLRWQANRALLRAYSGQSGCTVQLQLSAGTTTAAWLGVMATKPMSLMGEFGPEKTSLTAAVTEPDEPLYGCGRAGPPPSAPGTVMGPSVCVFVAEMKPAPARLHPSPF